MANLYSFQRDAYDGLQDELLGLEMLTAYYGAELARRILAGSPRVGLDGSPVIYASDADVAAKLLQAEEDDAP